MPASLVWTLVALTVFASVSVAMFRVWRAKDRAWGHLDEAGIHRGLSMFLKRGYDGSIAVFTDRSTGLFLQFRKYIHEPGVVGIESHFPRAPWSQSYYQGVQDILVRSGVSFERLAVPGDDPTVEFIRVDYGRDVELAAMVVSQVAMEVFRLPKLDMRLRAEEICVHDELVDRKDFPRILELARSPKLRTSSKGSSRER